MSIESDLRGRLILTYPTRNEMKPFSGYTALPVFDPVEYEPDPDFVEATVHHNGIEILGLGLIRWVDMKQMAKERKISQELLPF